VESREIGFQLLGSAQRLMILDISCYRVSRCFNISKHLVWKLAWTGKRHVPFFVLDMFLRTRCHRQYSTSLPGMLFTPMFLSILLTRRSSAFSSVWLRSCAVGFSGWSPQRACAMWPVAVYGLLWLVSCDWRRADWMRLP
jgi:hypothetical protein